MSELTERQQKVLAKIENVAKDADSSNIIDKINQIINLAKAEVNDGIFIGQAFLKNDTYKNIFDDKAEKVIHFEFNSAIGIEEDNALREKFDKELEKIQEGITNIVKISRINALDKTDEEKLAFFKE